PPPTALSPHFATRPGFTALCNSPGFTALRNNRRFHRTLEHGPTARDPLALHRTPGVSLVSPLFLPLPRLGAPARPSPSLDGATRDDGGPCADRRKQEISDVGQVSRAPSARQEVR